MTGAPSSRTHAVGVLFGPLVWAAHFLLVYASESLLCRLLDGGAHTWFVAAASALALAAILGDLTVQWNSSRTERPEAFLSHLRIGLDALSGLAVLLVAVTGLSIPACVQ